MKHMRSAALALGAGLFLVYGCGGEGNNPVGPTSNRPPEIRGITVTPATVPLAGMAIVEVNAVDPDGDAVTCRYSADAGTVSILDQANSCRGVYQNNGSPRESDRIVVTVTDTRNAATSSSASVALTGGPPALPQPTPNPGPTPTPGPNPPPSTPPPPGNSNPTVTVTSSVGSCQAPCSIDVTANASDPEGDQLSYAWSGCASGNAPTAKCSIPSAGNYTASVTVSDGRGGSATASRGLSGTSTPPPPNRPPTVTVTSTGTSCHPKPSAPCSIPVQAQASDPDGDTISYQWQGCATGTAATSNCSVTSPGTKTATVAVSDSKGASASASVNLMGTNAAPTVSAGGGGSCHPLPSSPCQVPVTGTASDADGDSLSYTWSGCASGTTATSTCSVTSPGTKTATVNVSDGWASATGSVDAQGTNDTPNVQHNGPITLGYGQTVTLNFNVTDDDTQHTCAESAPPPDSLQILSAGCYSITVRSRDCDAESLPDGCYGVAYLRVTDPWGATMQSRGFKVESRK